MTNLFTSQVPDQPDVHEAEPLTVATTVYFAALGTVTGGRYFAPLSVGAGTFTLKLWRVDTADPGTGTLLASKSMGTLTPGVWNSAVFDVPVGVTTGVVYRIGVAMSVGRYTVTGGFFATALTNGDITAPENGGSPTGISVRNGTFVASDSSFPTEQFNSGCYFVDPDFIAAGSSEDHTSSGTARATAVATAASLAARISSGSARSVALATALDETARITDGLAAASAAASAVAIARRVSAGEATAVASATSAVVPRRTSSGTARAIATGSNYTASGAPGPRLVSRNDPTRIVTRTQVAR